MKTHWKSTTCTLLAAALAPLVTHSANAASVLVDFGESDATGNWNGISNAVDGIVADAIDDTGTPTGITIAITSRFNGANTNGTSDAGAPYPSFATDDSFYGNADGVWGGIDPILSATIEITGLTIGVPYNFTFYGSRMGVGDNRETLYTLTGTNSGSVPFDVANNITETAGINSITPDGTGKISLVVSEGSNNSNGVGFYYLGAMEFAPVPEPATGVFLLGSLSLLALRRRR